MLDKAMIERIVARGVVSAIPLTTVTELVRDYLMPHNISSVLVMRGEEFLGIVTERDIAWKVTLGGLDPETTYIHHIMTPADKVHSVTRLTNEEECDSFMAERNIRHLPIIEDGKVLGIISMRDLLLGYKESPERLRRKMEGVLAHV